MKIALLHYHLKRGGVTTVLRQQARAARTTCRLCILTGETGDAAVPSETRVLPELAYTAAPANPDRIAEKILSVLNATLDGPCDVLHVHNPTLAKNVNLLRILAALQQRGIRLLLQIHDFAEDGRPEAYSRDAYPSNCHYAVINSRDLRILRSAGLSPDGVHLLPNMVDDRHSGLRTAPEQPLVLYPVRAIRRKNIGEALLISLFLPDGETLGITLPPNSPRDWPGFLGWQAFAQSHRLRVAFDVGKHHPFEDLMKTARYIITTSIAEGFGFSFLEPWVYGKTLLGRKLPDICRDFEKAGISLKHLYTRLRVPLAWFDHRRFYRKWSRQVHRAARHFDFELSESSACTAFATLTAAGDIDFGLLDETTQQEVIGGLIESRYLKHKMLAHNPALKSFAAFRGTPQVIDGNRRAVLSQFSADPYRERLLTVYRQVARKAVRHSIDRRRLVRAFLHLPGFSLLQWGG
jgi:hypothetical protein